MGGMGFYLYSPKALVLAPTRELAIQILESSRAFVYKAGIKIAAVYGGADKGHQLEQMANGVDILVATPGRLIDFLDTRVINLSQVLYFVLDEADRMLDMGFHPQVRQINYHLQGHARQNMFFSATWPAEVEELAGEICQNKPVKIKIGSGDDYTINRNITQYVEFVNEIDKRRRIQQLFKDINDNASKILVFVRTKKSADKLSKFLEMEGYRSASIHGDKVQHARDNIIAMFKASVKNVMVATDVASRGLGNIFLALTGNRYQGYKICGQL